jgi:hypothetical protein
MTMNYTLSTLSDVMDLDHRSTRLLARLKGLLPRSEKHAFSRADRPPGTPPARGARLNSPRHGGKGSAGMVGVGISWGWEPRSWTGMGIVHR